MIKEVKTPTTQKKIRIYIILVNCVIKEQTRKTEIKNHPIKAIQKATDSIAKNVTEIADEMNMHFTNIHAINLWL